MATFNETGSGGGVVSGLAVVYDAMDTYTIVASGGGTVSGLNPGLVNVIPFFPQTQSVKKGVCSLTDRIPKVTVIAMYPDGSSTKTWLQNLADDQWLVTSFNPQKRQVCIDVTATESELINTVTLDLPGIV